MQKLKLKGCPKGMKELMKLTKDSWRKKNIFLKDQITVGEKRFEWNDVA